MSIGRTITNRALDCRVLELSATTDHPERRGPYMVVQTGSAPDDPEHRECKFVLTRRGTWLHYYIFFMLPKDIRDEVAVFDSVNKVMELAESLSGKPRVESIESLRVILEEGDFQPDANDPATEALWADARESVDSPGTAMGGLQK